MGTYGSLILALVSMAVNENAPEVLRIDKCCKFGEHFHQRLNKCILRPGFNVTEKSAYFYKIGANISLTYWIPSSLHNETIESWHDDYSFINFSSSLTIKVPARDETVKRFLKVNNEQRRFELKYNKIKISPRLVSRQDVCFDATEDSRLSVVIISTITLKSLKKCCAETENLNSEHIKCEPMIYNISDSTDQTAKSSEILEQHVLSSLRSPQVNDSENVHFRENTLGNDGQASHIYQTQWYPKRLSQYVQGVIQPPVTYNALQYMPGWNIVAREGSDFNWTFLPKEPFIEIKSQNRSVYDIQGVTENYCFDIMVNDTVSTRVLVAAVTKANKCCHKGEQLNMDLSSCEARPGFQPEYAGIGVVDFKNRPEDAYWVPEYLIKNRLPIKFGEVHSFLGKKQFSFVRDDSSWNLDYNTRAKPVLAVNITRVSGNQTTLKTTKYCIDAYQNDEITKIVILAEFIHLNASIAKCCFPGEVISEHGYCVRSNHLDWSPFDSSLFGDDYVVPVLMPSVCRKYPYQTQKATPGIHIRASRSNIREHSIYCYDWQRAEGALEEVLGWCVAPIVRWHDGVRPLGAVAAALLGVAAVVAVVRGETRRTAHGRALACHALSLSASNGLQTAWFFETDENKIIHCKHYAHSIYFFLLAANFWMCAIAVNMARKFRQPLRSLGGGHRKKTEGTCKRFAIMSIFAWGGPTFITIMTANINKLIDHEKAYLPSFMETKSCYMLHEEFRLTTPGMTYSQMSSLFYYYAPMTLLVALNSVCVTVTVCGVKVLRRGTSIVHNTTTSNEEIQGCFPNRFMENALVYTKLLLTAGIMELGIEMIAWGVSREKYIYSDLTTSMTIKIRPFAFDISGTILDLLRALSVFWLCTGKRCVGTMCVWARDRGRRLENVVRGKAGEFRRWLRERTINNPRKTLRLNEELDIRELRVTEAEKNAGKCNMEV